MSIDNKSIAVILFTHDAETEIKHKCFSDFRSKKTNRLVAEGLIKSAEDRIIKTELPYFIFTTKEQTGSTFGERLTNSIESVFKKGFEKVIVTGNDCPELSAGQLIETKKLLDVEDIVIGPTNKGGTYLIGISKDGFDKRMFENLPWQSEKLLKGLIEYAQHLSNRHSLLKELSEINCSQDLIAYIRNSYTNEFSRLLASLISTNSSKQIYFHLFRKQELVNYLFRITAPPLH